MPYPSDSVKPCGGEFRVRVDGIAKPAVVAPPGGDGVRRHSLHADAGRVVTCFHAKDRQVHREAALPHDGAARMEATA